MKKITLIASVALLLTACIKSDNFDPDKIAEGGAELTLPIPLGKASITFANLEMAKDTNIKSDCPTCVVRISILKDLFSYTPTELMAVPIQTTQFSVDGPTDDVSGFPNFKLETTSPISLTGLNTVKLTSLKLDTGNITLSFNYDLPHPADITFTIPEATKDGKAFSQTILNVKKGTLPQNFSLNGYTIDMTKGTDGYNSFSTKATVLLKTSVTKVATTTNDLKMDLVISNLKPSQTKGFLGNQIISFPEGSFDIDLSKGTFEGVNMNFEEPELTLKMENNGLDIPLSGFLTKFEAQGDKGDFPITVSNDLLKNVKVDSKVEIKLDKTTPGLKSAISSTPKKFSYTFEGETNKGLTAGSNTLNSSGSLNVKADISLPLVGYAENLYIKDTIDINFGDNLSKIISMEIVLEIDNGFPISAKSIDLYAMNSLGEVNYLTTIKDFLLADIAADGTITPKKSKSTALISSDKIGFFKSANRLVINGKLVAGTPTAPLKIKSSDYMKIAVGVNARFKL